MLPHVTVSPCHLSGCADRRHVPTHVVTPLVPSAKRLYPLQQVRKLRFEGQDFPSRVLLLGGRRPTDAAPQGHAVLCDLTLAASKPLS